MKGAMKIDATGDENMTNEVSNPDTVKNANKKTRTTAILVSVCVVAILAVFFFAPIVPVTGHCFAVPLHVLFSPSSMLTDHQVGAFYVQNTNYYGLAPFSPSPTVSHCE